METTTTKLTTVPPIGTLVRLKKGSHEGRKARVAAGSHEGGLTLDFLDEHGEVSGPTGYYVIDKPSVAATIDDWIEVVEAPAWQFPRYSLVTHVNANANDMPGEMGECYGVVVAQDEPPTGELTVMRVGEHLGVGTQDWPVSETLAVEQPPQIETDYGKFPLGARVVFSKPYEGLRGTLVGRVGSYAAFLCDEDQQDQYDPPPESFNPDVMDTGQMFTPTTCSFTLLPEQGEKKPLGVKSKDGVPIYVGDRLEYIPGNKDWAGTIVEAIEPAPGSTKKFKMAEPLTAYHAQSSSYKVGDRVGLQPMDLRHVVGPVAEQVGFTKDGVPIRIGDRVLYDGGAGWEGTHGTIVGKESTGLGKVTLEPTKADGSPHESYPQYGPEGAYPAGLSFFKMTVVSKEEEEPKVKLGVLAYPDDSPICVGDKVIRTEHDSAFPVGTLATVKDQAGGSVSVAIENESNGVWSVGTFREVGSVIHPDYKYADGVPLRFGDRVVYDPGHSKAGKTGTLVGTAESGGLKYGSVVQDVPGPIQPTTWGLGNFSRLQDEDKEKVADDAPKAVAVLERVEELFDRLDALKGDLESRVSEIETELSSAEQNTPEVSYDTDDIGISVSTSNEELLGMISYDGCGVLAINDSAVDDHARENSSIDLSDFNVEVMTEGLLSDLHTAVASGGDLLNEYLATLDEVKAVVNEVLSTEGIEDVAKAKVITPDAATFEGTITNARFGVVLPEDAETGPTLRFDVVAGYEEASGDSSHTQATRRVRLTGPQIGAIMSSVGVSDVKHLEGRKAVLTETPYGGWYPTAVAEV